MFFCCCLVGIFFVFLFNVSLLLCLFPGKAKKVGAGMSVGSERSSPNEISENESGSVVDSKEEGEGKLK